MYIQYEKYSDLLSEEEGFGLKIINEIIDSITEQITFYCQERYQYYKRKYGVDIEINYKIQRCC